MVKSSLFNLASTLAEQFTGKRRWLVSRGDQAEEIVLTVFRSGAGLQLVELIVSVTDMSVCVDVCHQTSKSLLLLQFV